MKNSHHLASIALGATLIGTGFTSALAAEPTIRELAKERGRFIGTILNSEWFNDAIEPEFEEIHKTQFNVVVAENEMKFDATEPAENEFNFAKGDKMVKYAQENKIRVRGHALAWHSQVAGWVSSNYGGQKEKLLAVLKNHIEKVVGHYKGQVAEWDVVNEAINDDYNAGWRSNGSVWYEGIGAEFLDSAFVWAHKADPDAELCYNDYSLEWGLREGSKASFVVEQVKRWKKKNIPITCVGTQTHIEIAHETTPQNVRALAKALAELDVTLNITELDIGFPKGEAGKLTAADYAKQGHLYRQFMDVFLEEPNMGEFVIWGLTDAHSWLDGRSPLTTASWRASWHTRPQTSFLRMTASYSSTRRTPPRRIRQSRSRQSQARPVSPCTFPAARCSLPAQRTQASKCSTCRAARYSAGKAKRVLSS